MTIERFIELMSHQDKLILINNEQKVYLKESQEIMFDTYEKYTSGQTVNRDCGHCRSEAMQRISRIIKAIKNEY